MNIYLWVHKDNANREQNKMNSFIFYAKVQLIFAFLQRLIKIQRCYPFECIKKKGDTITWIASPSLFLNCKLYASVFSAGMIDTYLLSSLVTLKLTVPSTKAKRVWSLPIPMFSPGWNSVPLWRMMILPALQASPPNILTPNLLLCYSRPFLELPTPFLCAISSYF